MSDSILKYTQKGSKETTSLDCIVASFQLHIENNNYFIFQNVTLNDHRYGSSLVTIEHGFGRSMIAVRTRDLMAQQNTTLNVL